MGWLQLREGENNRDGGGGGRRKKRGGEGGEKKREEFWERLAMVQSSVRRIARRDGGRERKEGETFLEIALRVFP